MDGLRNDAIRPRQVGMWKWGRVPVRSGLASRSRIRSWSRDPHPQRGSRLRRQLAKRDDYNASTKLLSCWEASRLKMTVEQAACRNCLDFARFISTLKHLLPGKVSTQPEHGCNRWQQFVETSTAPPSNWSSSDKASDWTAADLGCRGWPMRRPGVAFASRISASSTDWPAGCWALAMKDGPLPDSAADTIRGGLRGRDEMVG